MQVESRDDRFAISFKGEYPAIFMGGWNEHTRKRSIRLPTSVFELKHESRERIFKRILATNLVSPIFSKENAGYTFVDSLIVGFPSNAEDHAYLSREKARVNCVNVSGPYEEHDLVEIRLKEFSTNYWSNIAFTHECTDRKLPKDPLGELVFFRDLNEFGVVVANYMGKFYATKCEISEPTQEAIDCEISDEVKLLADALEKSGPAMNVKKLISAFNKRRFNISNNLANIRMNVGDKAADAYEQYLVSLIINYSDANSLVENICELHMSENPNLIEPNDNWFLRAVFELESQLIEHGVSGENIELSSDGKKQLKFPACKFEYGNGIDFKIYLEGAIGDGDLPT